MAAVDFFLKIDGIDGESKDAKHKNEIDIASFSWGATQSGTAHQGGGFGGGKVQAGDVHFVSQYFSKASPKLFLACASGEHIKKAVLICRRAGKEQQEFLKWTFSDLLISSYQSTGHGGSDGLPTESFSLNFTKIEMEYKEQKPDGTLGGATPAGWDVGANQKV
jgi:type VI secretion system secreted protein Hcp